MHVFSEILSAVDTSVNDFSENALQQLMCNGFELRNLYIVCVSFETIESPIKQPILDGMGIER